MRDLDWFDGPEEEGEQPRGRRRWLLPLAAVPWLVVAALLVLPNLGAEADRGTDTAEVHDHATEPAPDAGQPAAPPVATEDTPEDTPDLPHDGPPADTVHTTLEVEELRGRWRVAAGAEEAAALAVVIARSWLTGLGPRLEGVGAEPPEGLYAEHLVIEALEHPSADTAVVTLLAVVLEDDGDGGGEVGVRRLAVPILLPEEGPRPGGRPWELPGPGLEPPRIELQEVEDPALTAAAAAALDHAGLDGWEVLELASAVGLPTVATVTDGVEEQQVWLRPHLDGLVVAGTTLAGAGEQQP